jgi:hypothetical protein
VALADGREAHFFGCRTLPEMDSARSPAPYRTCGFARAEAANAKREGSGSMVLSLQ